MMYIMFWMTYNFCILANRFDVFSLYFAFKKPISLQYMCLYCISPKDPNWLYFKSFNQKYPGPTAEKKLHSATFIFILFVY